MTVLVLNALAAIALIGISVLIVSWPFIRLHRQWAREAQWEMWRIPQRPDLRDRGAIALWEARRASR